MPETSVDLRKHQMAGPYYVTKSCSHEERNWFSAEFMVEHQSDFDEHLQMLRSEPCNKCRKLRKG